MEAHSAYERMLNKQQKPTCDEFVEYCGEGGWICVTAYFTKVWLC